MTAIAIDNLAAFGVEEMSTEITEHVAGGLGGWEDFLINLLANAAYSVLSDPGSAKRAFMEGFNAAS